MNRCPNLSESLRFAQPQPATAAINSLSLHPAGPFVVDSDWVSSSKSFTAQVMVVAIISKTFVVEYGVSWIRIHARSHFGDNLNGRYFVWEISSGVIFFFGCHLKCLNNILCRSEAIIRRRTWVSSNRNNDCRYLLL